MSSRTANSSCSTFAPTAPAEYNAVLNSKLDAGSAGDLITCRPFDPSLGLYDKAQLKIVQGNSIAQAFQFVETGNAELGFVALSQVQAPGQPATGSLWRVPQAYYPEIRQDVVLLRRGEANPAATALLQFLREPEARALIAGYGYALAD